MRCRLRAAETRHRRRTGSGRPRAARPARGWRRRPRSRAGARRPGRPRRSPIRHSITTCSRSSARRRTARGIARKTSPRRRRRRSGARMARSRRSRLIAPMRRGEPADEPALERASRRAEADRQPLERVDAERRVVRRLAVQLEVRHPRRQERERLLELGAREVRAQAEVRAGTEGQRLRPAALGRDVEVAGRLVARPGRGWRWRCRRRPACPRGRSRRGTRCPRA